MLWMISTVLHFAKAILLRAFGCWSKDQHRRLLSSLVLFKNYQQGQKFKHPAEWRRVLPTTLPIARKPAWETFN